MRIEQLVDAGSFVERDADLTPVDSLTFVDLKAYPDRLVAANLQTGLRDSTVWGVGAIGGRPVSLCVFDFFFMGGSMGSVTGEKVARAGEAALAERIPLIIVSSSGGARMQEGTYSLMQLAKTMSGGEQQMVAIGRGMMAHPKLIMIDEMSLGLAPLVVDSVFDGLDQARKSGITVVLIEQFIHRALAMADQCVILSRGEISWTGEASAAGEEVLDRSLGESAGSLS